MDEPIIAKYKPYYYELEEGKNYLWCSCGRSAKQPFCDGSHKGTSFKPVRYTGQADCEEVLFCGCKHSKDQPFCDGAHNNLLDTYELEDPEDTSAALATSVERDPLTLHAPLNNECYVRRPNKNNLTQCGSLAWCVLINAELGSQYQSQFYLKQSQGTSPVVSFGDSEVAILVTGGTGQIEISGVSFEITKHAGIYIKSGEAFSLTNINEQALQLYITACPQDTGLSIADVMPDNFDTKSKNRVVDIDEENGESMGDRFFQILIGKDVGSNTITEFIGDVPQSKAAMHRHLYEETLVILKGEGVMWTEDKKTVVSAGDIIFLPRKQIHSLECTSAQGMRLAGVIYPGDNPSINY